MKELSIEEKAKRYDEVIKKVNDYYEGKTKLYSDVDKTLDYLFPALKEESEDERIRKWLINYFREVCDNVAEKEKNAVLAWLEKQGEQKTVDEIAKEVCKNKESAVTFLKSTGIMNEKGELADEYKIEQDEQNPVWSEEDKDYYDAIIAKLEVTQDDALLTDNQMKFLKSLKDKIQSQPQWKPSDEQMEGIECTIKTLRYQLNAGDNRLDSLYNDLKKLREK